MPYFAMTCGICHKNPKVKAKDEQEARLFFENMNVCPASCHPSLPSVAALSSGLRKITRFEYFRADL